MNIEQLIEFVENRVYYSLNACVLNPAKQNSKLFMPLKPDELGMSGAYTRLILNNICDFPICSYLEIGLATGSTFCAATYENDHPYSQFVGFDVWSGTFHKSSDGGKKMKARFYKNLKELANITPDRKSRIEIFDSNFFSLDTIEVFNERKLRPVNVYFYDAEHTKLASYYSLIHAYDLLDDYFVYIVDDWNDDEVRAGVFKSLVDTGIQIHRFWHLPCEAGSKLYKESNSTEWTYHDIDPIADFGNYKTFFNGIGVFVLEKNKKSYFDICREGQMLKIGTPNVKGFAQDHLLDNWGLAMTPPGNFEDLCW